MTTYTPITNGQLDQDSPVTQPLMTSLRDNPLAMAEGASGSPDIYTNWVPYDDGDGKLWDFATDGAVATITTPDFADRFEYRIFLGNVEVDVGANLYYEAYRGTSAAYATILTLSNPGVTEYAIGYLNLLEPMTVRNWHMTSYWSVNPSSFVDAVASISELHHVIYHATAQKITKVRLSLSGASNFDGGTVYLYKRLSYV